MQLVGFTVKLAGSLRQRRLGRGQHAEKEFGFLGLFHAATDRMPKILLGDTVFGGWCLVFYFRFAYSLSISSTRIGLSNPAPSGWPFTPCREG